MGELILYDTHMKVFFMMLSMLALMSCSSEPAFHSTEQPIPAPETENTQGAVSAKPSDSPIETGKNCGAIVHGTTQSGYWSPSPPCVMGTRTCENGKWSGPELFATCTEEDKP